MRIITTRDNKAYLLEVFGEVGDGALLACVKEHQEGIALARGVLKRERQKVVFRRW